MRVTRLKQLSSAAMVFALAACAGTTEGVSNAPPDPADEGGDVAADGPAEVEQPTHGEVASSRDADDAGRSAPGTAFDVRVHGPELLWRTDTQTEVIALLHPEGESTFVAAAVRPGSDASDATIATLTMAEGFYDLRSLTYREGVASELTVFPEPYRPNQDMLADGGVAPIPVWAPDGDSLAWLEWGLDGQVQLRTIGWSGDAPGTGRTADDNATFAVDLPTEVWLDGWQGHGEGTTLEVVDAEGRAWTIALARQADGAWALDGDAVERT